jgi:hypothetical protein
MDGGRPSVPVLTGLDVLKERNESRKSASSADYCFGRFGVIGGFFLYATLRELPLISAIRQ